MKHIKLMTNLMKNGMEDGNIYQNQLKLNGNDEPHVIHYLLWSAIFLIEW